MADGILKVGTITTSSGSGTITLGQSGETIALGSGASQALASNTPAFRIEKSSNQTISNNTRTKATFNSEIYDTNNAFASDKFTVPSGEAGKYQFTTLLRFYCDANNAALTSVGFYKNGSTLDTDANFELTNGSTDSIRQTAIPYTTTLNLSVNDYIEVYGLIKGGGTLYISSGSYFEGQKLIGV